MKMGSLAVNDFFLCSSVAASRWANKHTGHSVRDCKKWWCLSNRNLGRPGLVKRMRNIDEAEKSPAYLCMSFSWCFQV